MKVLFFPFPSLDSLTKELEGLSFPFFARGLRNCAGAYANIGIMILLS